MTVGAVAGLMGAVCPAQASLIIGNSLSDRQYATDYPPGSEPVNVLVVNASVLPAGQLNAFLAYDMANSGSSPTPSAGNSFYGVILQPLGGGNYKVAYETALETVPTVATSQTISYAASFNVQAGDLFGFFGSGVPVSTGTGTDTLYYPTQLAAPTLNQTITLGSGNFPVYPQARDYAFAVDITPVPEASTYIAGAILLLPFAVQGLRKLRGQKTLA